MTTHALSAGDARSPVATRFRRDEVIFAVAAFAVLSVLVLTAAPHLAEPDDHAYQASIIALEQGHLTLSTAQYQALSRELGHGLGGIVQWVYLASGRWISEKNPGYPFLALPFAWLGLIRLAPLCYGALGCAGLFAGARRWLGQVGGAAAVGLFCSSGAALLFAWRDYMPTFTEVSLIAAGAGTLLWAILAEDAGVGRRTWTGLAGFIALEAAVFVRYTDVLVLGVAVLAALAVWHLRPGAVPARSLAWWIGSVAVAGAGIATFNQVVYGGVLSTGYRSGEIVFGLGAIGTNLRLMPAHLIEAMPVLLLGLAALAWIAVRWARHRREPGEAGVTVRRDAGVGLTLAASWAALWGLYLAYYWTTSPSLDTLQVVRFYVPAAGPIALAAAWLISRVPSRRALTAAAAVADLLFVLGAWSFASMRTVTIAGPGTAGRPCRPSAATHCPAGSRGGPGGQHGGPGGSGRPPAGSGGPPGGAPPGSGQAGPGAARYGRGWLGRGRGWLGRGRHGAVGSAG